MQIGMIEPPAGIVMTKDELKAYIDRMPADAVFHITEMVSSPLLDCPVPLPDAYPDAVALVSAQFVMKAKLTVAQLRATCEKIVPN